MNLAQLVREIIDAKVQRWSIPPKKLSLHMGPVKAQVSLYFPLDVSSTLSWSALQFFVPCDFLNLHDMLLVSGVFSMTNFVEFKIHYQFG